MKRNGLSNWRKNILVYKIDSLFNWFFIPIGTYVLIWNQDLALSFTQINTTVAIGLLWSVFLELPSGALADMVGRKKTVLLGRFGLLLGYLLFLWQLNWLGVLLFQIFYYTDNAFTSGSISALLYDSLIENKRTNAEYKKVEADTFFLNTMGMAVAAVLSGFLYSIDPLLPFSSMLLIAGTSFVASLFYEEPLLDSEKFSVKNYLKQNIEGTKHIFRYSKITWISLFTIATEVVSYAALWYLYEPRITEAFADASLIAWLIGGTYLIRVIGIKLIPVVDRCLKQSSIPVFIVFIQGIGGFLSFFQNGFGAVGSVYLKKMSDGYRRPVVLAMQNEEIEAKYRATALSASNLIANLIMAPLGLVLGVAIDHLGVANTLGYFSVLGMLVSLPLAVRLRRELE